MSKTITVDDQHGIEIVANVCRTMFQKSGKLSVTIKKYAESLSDKQRGLYFTWIGILAGDMGYTKDEMHIFLKGRFLLNIYMADLGNKSHDVLRDGWANLQIVRQEMPDMYPALYATVLESVSITTASVDNMREYLTEIDNLAHWQGVRLPKPEDLMMAGVLSQPSRR